MVPKALKEVLEVDKKSRDAWGKLASSRRSEILAYLNSLKTSESLERNVRKVLEGLG